MGVINEIDGGSKRALAKKDELIPVGTIPIITSTVSQAEKVKPKKVAILGFAGTSRNLAPFNNPEWEIWGLNALYKEITWASNITRWFEFHPRKDIASIEAGGGPEYEAFLRQLKIPFYTEIHYDEFPTSIPYPLEKICNTFHIGTDDIKSTIKNDHVEFKNVKNAYLTNSISSMLALAIYEMLYCDSGIEEIGTWGVDMAHSSEYSAQRPSVEYYLGILEGLRLTGKLKNWTLPKESSLLKSKGVYGYEVDADRAFRIGLKARAAQLNATRNAHLQKVQQNHDAEQQFLGAIQENQHMNMNWGS